MKKKSYIKVWTQLKNKIDSCISLLRYHDDTITKRFIYANFKRMLPSAVLIFFISIVDFIIYLFFDYTSPIRSIYIMNSIYLVIVNLIFLGLFFKIKKEPQFPYHKAQYINIFFILLNFIGFLCFTLLEISYRGTFQNLILMGWICTVITFLKPIHAISFSVITTSLAIIFYPNQIPFASIMTIIISHIVFLSISQFLYYTNKRYFMGEKQLHSKNIELQKQLTKDHLTNVFNRYGLNSHIDVLLPYTILSKIPVAVLMIDIDYFKHFNDHFGHLKGDECLIKIAKAIQDATKKQTDLVCRFGGEEFLVFLYNIDFYSIEIVINRIQKAIQDLKITTAKQDASPYVSVSIGASHGILSSKSDFEQLIEFADQELYLAKSKGRNTSSIRNKD